MKTLNRIFRHLLHFQEQGISTLQDVELLQQSPELQIFKLPASP